MSDELKRKPGRPMLGDKPTRAVNMSLDPDWIDYARTIGEGNVSKGVRVALAYHRYGPK